MYCQFKSLYLAAIFFKPLGFTISFNSCYLSLILFLKTIVGIYGWNATQMMITQTVTLKGPWITLSRQETRLPHSACHKRHISGFAVYTYMALLCICTIDGHVVIFVIYFDLFLYHMITDNERVAMCCNRLYVKTVIYNQTIGVSEVFALLFYSFFDILLSQYFEALGRHYTCVYYAFYIFKVTCF